jgi:hypothetical protein
MVVPYKKVEETDTQVKNYINELSKARSFQAPGELNDEIQYVKQPTPITQTTVYKSLEGLVQEMKSKNASDTTINELNNTIKSLKEEAAVKPESNTYGDINQELKVTVAALRETSESLNEMISYFRKEAAYMNPKNEKMEVDEEKMKNKNNDAKIKEKEQVQKEGDSNQQITDINDEFYDFEKPVIAKQTESQQTQAQKAKQTETESKLTQAQIDKAYTRSAEDKVFQASENLAKKNPVYAEQFHEPLSKERGKKKGLGRALDDTLMPSRAMYVASNLTNLEYSDHNEAKELVASLAMLQKIRANGNKEIKYK